MRSKLILFLAIVMGVVTTYFFYQYMNQFNVETTASENKVAVVTASELIMKNERISRDMLEMTQIAEANVHAQMIRDMDEIEGQYVTANIEAGEHLLSHRVQHETEENLFVSRKVRDGYRAVSVGVNMVQSVTTLIEPEDDVDVVFSEQINRTNDNEEGNNQTNVVTDIILEEVRVLSVGRRMIESNTVEDYMEYSAVTLELMPQDVVTLVNASERGNIHLSLHSRLDPDKEE